MSDHAEHAEHHVNYVKIWGILVVLLIISVVGPELGMRTVTLITAFGIAIVKAYLVAKNFMHINLAPRYVMYLCATSLIFMLLFFAGTAPDVMKMEGSGWEKPAWKQAAAEHAAGAHAEEAHH